MATSSNASGTYRRERRQSQAGPSLTYAQRLVAKRQLLIESIFGQSTLPTAGADATAADGTTPFTSNVSSVTKFTFNLSCGYVMRCHLMRSSIVAASPNTKLVIHHAGHGGTYLGAPYTTYVQYYLDRGYDVLGCAGPLYNPSDFDTLQVTGWPFPCPDGVTRNLIFHDGFIDIEKSGINCGQFFLTTVIRGLNQALSIKAYSKVYMFGLSGGGWATHLSAALDTRIRRSYPVSGNIPRRIQDAAWGDYGDYEQDQDNRRWFKASEALDIYALGAYPSRVQRQVLYQYDGCCFGWHDRQASIQQYRDEIRSLLGANGDFNIWFDSSNGGSHIVTNSVLAAMEAEILAD